MNIHVDRLILYFIYKPPCPSFNLGNVVPIEATACEPILRSEYAQIEAVRLIAGD